MKRLPGIAVIVLLLCGIPVSAQEVDEGEQPAGAAADEPDFNVHSEDDPEPPKQQESDPEHAALIRGIIDRLVGADQENSLRAAVALRKLAGPGDLKAIVEALKRADTIHARRALIETLGDLQDVRAGRALRFELQKGNPQLRPVVAEALGRLKDDWPIPLLSELLVRSEDITLKKRAASALGRIGSDSALYALETALPQLKAESVRRAVIWAVDKIRGRAKPAEDKKVFSSKEARYFEGMRYYLSEPAVKSMTGPKTWILVCVHGFDLDPETLHELCTGAAKDNDMLGLTPYFDNLRFPEFNNLNIHGERADLALLRLIDHIATTFPANTRELYLFGFGAGGAFVQRFALAYPDRIARASLFARGLAHLDPEQFFPDGVKATPLAPDLSFDPIRAVKTDLYVFGAADGGKGKDGYEFFREARRYARNNGVLHRVRLERIGDQSTQPVIFKRAIELMLTIPEQEAAAQRD